MLILKVALLAALTKHGSLVACILVCFLMLLIFNLETFIYLIWKHLFMALLSTQFTWSKERSITFTPSQKRVTIKKRPLIISPTEESFTS